MSAEYVDAVVVGGGQSGLAAAHAFIREGRSPVVLEASDEPVGSWPRYYDSLTLFSPARHSGLPGMPFDGDGDRYPRRDEVVEHLRRFANRLDADIRTGHRVEAVTRTGDGAFSVRLGGGRSLTTATVIAATGGFGNPHRPGLPGLASFTGRLLHAGEYRNPEPFEGQRVVIVGAGNSAVQIGAELAEHADVTLATRRPVKLTRQRPLGRDLHWWLKVTGLDTAPVGRHLRTPPTQLVIDDGRYRSALAAGAPDRRPLFTGISGDHVTWADGTSERVDAIVLATGYRPDLGYLGPLGVMSGDGHPRHREGVATNVPGLGFVGLEWQRSLSSASVRGVGRDAARVARLLSRPQ